MTLPSRSLLFLLVPLLALLISLTSVLSPSLGDLLCSPRLAHSSQLIKKQRLPRRQLCNVSHCFVVQAEHLICGEALALTNNTSASCYVCHCIILWYHPNGYLDFWYNEHWRFCYRSHLPLWCISALEVCKVRGSIELRKMELHFHCLSLLLWRRNISLNGSVAWIWFF